MTRTPFLDGKQKQLLIDGKWVEAQSGRTFDTINPYNGKVLATVAHGDAADVDLAVAAARRAFEGPWKQFKPVDRQRVLLRLADLIEQDFDEIGVLDVLDMGGPISSLPRRRERALTTLRYYAGLATATHGRTIENSQPGNIASYTVKEPLGVVGAIIPWNGPLFMALWKVAPALAAGCTVVLKPAEQAPLSSLRLGELCLEAGIPPGVVNVITGFGEAGAALAEHPDVDKITFTGSTEVGQKILRASAGNVKRVTLELGGKSPNIVFADADLDLAVPGAAMAIFANSGQICSAGSRLYVERKIHDEFVERVAGYASQLRLGDPMDPATHLGPVVSKEQLDRVLGYLDSGREQGARVAAGGEQATEGDLANGYFVKPTVFCGVDESMRIAREEIFGPVVAAMPFDSVEEVIARGNATQYGLGSGVWTTNLNTAQRVSQGLRAGSVWVNCYQLMDAAVPFGGYKMSGFGREGGVDHIDEFMAVKAVWIRST
ncbi:MULTISPECIES: aldehyde dehydrogenase family protein [Pandoraea]|uniref:Aldehyde dehydrogenase family protein n=1 Tax=Pandoraea fibrosis TaxID=1891094 RepID=A0ABX6HVH9_9BURK|nr:MULTISPECIES: aldehyde dehydrogenase family protein [Pandoraea]ALS65145.1 betaine-aldehyde dehydrogenase [Pandoraea apista]QHE91564.1 aldehyde dehydrogenase family protein [Pandoraea fibrosis]QHF14878.1 aldehyde dehydrogenase family protein [Pandoraea fibrosis]RRW92382.1 aldehyde dehydrogenase family protein [Pandoraea apista]RRX01848.1 aldehyde dehydrogenase family protein [Pandoraea apista]